MSKFLSDPSAMSGILGKKSEEPIVVKTDVKPSWMEKLAAAAKNDTSTEEETIFQDTFSSEVPEEEETEDIHESVPIMNKMTSQGSSSESKRWEEGKIKGFPPAERKALKELKNYKKNATASEVEAFLFGFRLKQDYSEVSLRATISTLESVISRLTSASTSVSRAASDIVDSTTSSASRLSVLISDHIEHVRAVEKPAKTTKRTVTVVNTPEKKSTSGGSESRERSESYIKGTTPETELASLTEANQKESNRIISGAPPEKEVQAPKAPEVPLTVSDVVDIMGIKEEALLAFYNTTAVGIISALENCRGPKEEFLRGAGGKNAAVGVLKKLLKTLKK